MPPTKTKKNILFGLHIGKCAGTTFNTIAQSQLQPYEIYVNSSFVNNLDRHRLDIAEIPNIPGRLRFIFGHHLHESMLCLLPADRIFAFTAIRNPVSRFKSVYYQRARRHKNLDLPPPAPKLVAEAPTSSMCFAINEAFPSVSPKNLPASDRAIKVLGLFDFVYDSERTDTAIEVLCDELSIKKTHNRRENQTSKAFSSDSDIHALAEEAAAFASKTKHFEDDIRLFDKMQERLNKHSSELSETALKGRRDLTDLLQRSGEDQWARMTGFVASRQAQEFKNHRRLTEVKALLTRKRKWLSTLEDAIAKVER